MIVKRLEESRSFCETESRLSWLVIDQSKFGRDLNLVGPSITFTYKFLRL